MKQATLQDFLALLEKRGVLLSDTPQPYAGSVSDFVLAMHKEGNDPAEYLRDAIAHLLQELDTRAASRANEFNDFSVTRGDDFDSLISRLLNSYFWPSNLNTKDVYQRQHDDHDGTWSGQLAVTFSEDGDAWVWCTPCTNDTQESLRFRMPMIGGGASPRVRTALVILAEAIRLDNTDRPLERRPQASAKEAST